MGDRSAIQWTDATWNPARGCSRVSAGCENCYAEGIAARFSGPGMKFEGFARRVPNGEPRWTGNVALVPEKLDEPLRWRRPRRIFVNSMSDLFHESLPDAAIDRVFAVMMLTARWSRDDEHTYQVLTKRAERMRAYMSDAKTPDRVIGAANRYGYPQTKLNTEEERAGIKLALAKGSVWPLPNVWLGASVEHQDAADERIPLLLQTPAAVRFLSIEPLLGPVDLHRLRGETCEECGEVVTYSALHETAHGACAVEGDEPVAWPPLSWVIVGGESGPNARPMHPKWARDLRDQCVAAGVPFFFKQWGKWAPGFNEDHYAWDAGENDSNQHLWLDVSGDAGACWIHDEDGTWSNWTGDPPPGKADGELADSVEVMGNFGKKRAGRVLDGREWNEFPGARTRAEVE